jgi:hypothetical protein
LRKIYFLKGVFILENFINKLAKLGIKTTLEEGIYTTGIRYDKTIRFPEVSERDMKLIGKVSGDELILYQRIGLKSINWRLGKFSTMNDETISFLKEQYFTMAQMINSINSCDKAS